MWVQLDIDGLGFGLSLVISLGAVLGFCLVLGPMVDWLAGVNSFITKDCGNCCRPLYQTINLVVFNHLHFYHCSIGSSIPHLQYQQEAFPFYQVYAKKKI